MILGAALMLAVALDCRAPANTAAMVECSGREAGTAEAALNATWRQVMAAMKARDANPDDPAARPAGPSYAQALLESQRAWLAFRGKECLIESYEYRAGTLQPAIENGCTTSVTQARIKQLKDMMWTQ